MAAPPKYQVQSCCDSTKVFIFNTFLPIPGFTAGVYIYSGGFPYEGLVPGECYEISEIFTPTTGYPLLPAFNANFTSTGDAHCADSDCCTESGGGTAPDSGIGTIPCYALYACSGFVLYTTSNVSDYINDFLSFEEYPGECFYILNAPTGCMDDPVIVTVDTAEPCSCDCTCYYLSGTGTFEYINCNGELDTGVVPAQICSQTAPIATSATGNIELFVIDKCTDGVCPEKCYQLMNCDTREIIVSNSPELIQYALSGSVVTILGQEGCWTVTETEDCECAVSITVISSFTNCETCEPIIAYKLTNCDNSFDIIYSSQNLAAYVGKTVELDCGGCWNVEEINIVPPSTQPVKILFTYDDCVACGRTYYKLTDCAEIEPEVYTYTDLSAYVGKTIRLKNCLTCWTVETTRQIQNPGIVYVETVYPDVCTTCLEDFPCICSTITNYDIVAHDYRYVDCEGNLVVINVGPGQESDRICLRSWVGDDACYCVNVTINNTTSTASLRPDKINGYNAFNVISGINNYVIYNNGSGLWILATPDLLTVIAELPGDLSCPIGNWIIEYKDIYLEYYLSGGTLQVEGLFEYISSSLYTATIQGVDYRITVNNLQGSCKSYKLQFYNTGTASWETLATAITCNCFNGTVTTLNNNYFIVDNLCAITTVNCSVGFLPIIKRPTDNYVYYGDCVNGECPPKEYPKRKVKPGYSTPTCDIDKYEKITCRASEILYKIVLNKRYGISDCCPEENDKWLLKKEIIDLAALIDPDYDCKPLTSCCQQPIDSCSCNTPVRTCNS